MSGRNAVPALPRNRSARLDREAAPRRRRHAHALDVAQSSIAHAERAQRVEHHARVVGIEQAARARSSPSASAASSSVRLEMLFEPGRRTVPAARRDRRRSSVARSFARRAAPRARSASVRAPRAPRHEALQRRAVAACRSARGRPRAARRSGRARPAARRGWQRRCRATSPGELPAMRVKSRKPPAAKPKSSRGVRRARRSRRPARRRAGAAGGSPRRRRVVLLGRHARDARAARPPSSRARVSTASRRVSASGVSTTRAPRNSSALAASTPLFSAPAIGCAGHELREALRPAPRAPRATTSRLVLPASVTTALGLECRRDVAKHRRRICAHRHRDQHQIGVARRVAATDSAAASIDAERRWRARGCRASRPTPTTCAHAPARFSASANEPPIRPDADDRDALQAAHRASPSERCARARARKRSFSLRQCRR